MSRREWSMKQAGTNATVERHDSDYGFWYEGHIATPHGFVMVYTEKGNRQHGVSSYRAIVGGRSYTMVEHTFRKPRGLAIVAARWIRELTEP